ncbi:Alpha/Beta hydrolase protein [Lipomyces arxii]|uniref:Alpha/Beta hydrolase protein n=1 Tax=Lipomyces arxii TaxID=56418 RepID=UPI0034D009BC
MRLPTQSDFAGQAVVSITSPAIGPLTHAVLLLHGIGDTIAPFTALAKNLNLPRAVVIAVQAPQPMPFDLGGFQWGDDVVFSKDPASGEEVLSPDAEFNKARLYLDNVIRNVLERKCGFMPAENVILWGYGQGAMVALDMAACKFNLCAVVSVGGWIPGFVKPRDIIDLPRSTSVLLCGGDKNSAVTNEKVRQAEQLFKECRRVKFDMNGDLMPRNKQEMAPILRFLLRILIADDLATQGLS